MDYKYFKLSEFKCKCGCGENMINVELVKLLDKARDESGQAFIITSGYRCGVHNLKVGGSPRSSHVHGFAVDIAVNAANRDIIINVLKKYFKRIGVAKNFVHVDIDPSKSDASWSYE